MKIKALLAASLLIFAASCGKKDSTPVDLDANTRDFIGTVSVETSDGIIENTNVSVSCNFDKNGKTATVIFFGVKFAEKMPMMDITIPDVKIKTGTYSTSLECTNVDPIALGEPNPQYVVTDFSGTMTEDELSITTNFGDYSTTYNGTRKE